MNTTLTSTVVICCSSIDAFMCAQNWALRNKRTSILLTRSDWRMLAEHSTLLGKFDVISDDIEHPAFASFNTVEINSLSDDGMVAEGEWPQPLAILFTSGSSGKPKAIVKTPQALYGEQACLRAVFPHADADSVFLSTVPLEHMFGYTFGYWLPKLLNAEVYSKRVVLPHDLKLACAMSDKSIWIVTTPTHMRAYAELGVSFSNVAGVISATGPLTSELARCSAKCFGVPITEIYGSTETGAIACRTRHEDEQEMPDWTALSGISIYLDEAGMAVCKADHLEEAVVLGDLIEIRDSGFRILGRTGDIVKVAGKRHSLSTLNELLSSIPGVLDGTYFFSGNQNMERPESSRPAAFVVLEQGYSTKDVVNGLRGKVDSIFIPRPLFEVEYLPRLDTGKLRAADLESLFRECSIQNVHNLN